MGDGFGGLLQGKCTTAHVCDYDACTTDADCPDATNVCSCEGQTGGEDGRFGSVCIMADCHTDADCGSGYCSPSASFGCGGATVGYYCHTCADTCVNDSDCQPSPTNQGPAGYCAFDPTVGSWACGYSICAG